MLVAAAAGGAFLIVVAIRRRRTDEPELLAATAAIAPVGAVPPSPPPVRSLGGPVESQVPRWLRPSVRAARFESDNVKAPRPERARLAFATPGDEVAERLVVRYDLVQLLDRPDEALGVPHAELNSGDEVEVLERDDIWVRVQAPTGGAGWVPAMTLASADALGDPGAEKQLAVDVEEAHDEGDQPALEALLALAAARRAASAAVQPGPGPRPERPRNPRKMGRRKPTRGDRRT